MRKITDMRRITENHKHTAVRCIIAIAAAALLLCTGNTASAFERKVYRTGVNGNTFSRNITTEKRDYGYARSIKSTTNDGRSAGRSSEGNWDKESRTWSKRSSAYGFNGNSATREKSLTRTDDGYTRRAYTAGSGGNSLTRESEGHWNSDTKTWTKEITTSGTGEKR